MSKYAKQLAEMMSARGRSMMLDGETTVTVGLDDGRHVPILTRVPHETMPGLVLDRVAQYRLPVSRREVAPR